jgi:hypothetical protein
MSRTRYLPMLRDEVGPDSHIPRCAGNVFSPPTMTFPQDVAKDQHPVFFGRVEEAKLALMYKTASVADLLRRHGSMVVTQAQWELDGCPRVKAAPRMRANGLMVRREPPRKVMI